MSGANGCACDPKRGSELPQLDYIFSVLEAELRIDTNDTATADMVADGFRYFLRKEFAAELPILMRFYELEFQFLGRDRGSIRDRYRVRVKLNKDGRALKERVARLEQEIKDDNKPGATALAVISFLTALLGFGQAGMEVWEKRIEAQAKAVERVGQQLKNNNPVPIQLDVHIRPPDDSDKPPRGSRNVDL